MTHKELLARIKSLDIATIKRMSHGSLAKLTDRFEEALVRAILCLTNSNSEQLELIKAVKEGYKNWKKENNFMWGTFPKSDDYPQYMDQMMLDIECGMIITKDGAVFQSPAPKILQAKRDLQDYSTITSEMRKALFATPNPKQSKDEHLQQRVAALKKDLNEARDMLKQKDAQLKELQQENEQLRSQLDDDEEPDEEISLHDKVRLELLLQLMKKDGADLNKHGNKTKAAQVMQAITNLPITTCKNYCSNQDLSAYAHEEEILMFNTKLRVLGMQTSL